MTKEERATVLFQLIMDAQKDAAAVRFSIDLAYSGAYICVKLYDCNSVALRRIMEGTQNIEDAGTHSPITMVSDGKFQIIW